MAIAAEQAEATRATFVLAGLLADQLLAPDQHSALVAVAGWSVLNLAVAGKPVW